MVDLAARPPADSPLSPVAVGIDEALPVAVQRLTVGLLAGACADLRPRSEKHFDVGIHSARKKMKRLRALLRLVRDEIGYSAYRNENVVLRDTARTLAGMRDARVLHTTLDAVCDDYEGLLAEDAFARTTRFLDARYEVARRAITRQTVADAIVNLGAAGARFAAYPLTDVVRDDFAAIAPGIARVYRRGYRAHHRARETRDVHDLHEWRKRVKYLRHQMEALEALQPVLLGAYAALLDELGELLGVDHDHAVLADTVMAHADACRDERERWLLIALIYRRRGDLIAAAERLGDAAYAERPEAFVDRIAAYWEAGRR